MITTIRSSMSEQEQEQQKRQHSASTVIYSDDEYEYVEVLETDTETENETDKIGTKSEIRMEEEQKTTPFSNSKNNNLKSGEEEFFKSALASQATLSNTKNIHSTSNNNTLLTRSKSSLFRFVNRSLDTILSTFSDKQKQQDKNDKSSSENNFNFNKTTDSTQSFHSSVKSESSDSSDDEFFDVIDDEDFIDDVDKLKNVESPIPVKERLSILEFLNGSEVDGFDLVSTTESDLDSFQSEPEKNQSDNKVTKSILGISDDEIKLARDVPTTSTDGEYEEVEEFDTEESGDDASTSKNPDNSRRRQTYIEFLASEENLVDNEVEVEVDDNENDRHSVVESIISALKATDDEADSTAGPSKSSLSLLQEQLTPVVTAIPTVSVLNANDHDNIYKNIIPPKQDIHPHKHRHSLLARVNPLTKFLNENDPSNPDSEDDADSMVSGLTEALTLRTDYSTSGTLDRMSRVPSMLLSDDPESLKYSKRYKPVLVKVKSKSRQEFSNLFLIQELNRVTSNTNANNSNITSPRNTTTSNNSPATISISVDSKRAIFVLKFSPDGNFLAAAGAEGIIRIWRLLAQSVLEHNFDDSNNTNYTTAGNSVSIHPAPPRVATIFENEPVQVLHGHTAEILDLAWSSNNFLLSASMDKTVRLWHHTRSEPLGIFQHLDYVTSVAFHPKDSRLFLSGSLDCKLRLWSIQDQAIKYWNELPSGNFITAVAFTQSGKKAIAGTSGGIALVFETEGLKYHTQIHVRSSKSKSGKKITGIESVPGHFQEDERVVVSTNDSRIRMYSLRDKNVIYKYKGHDNLSSQIRASLSTDGDYVLSGSEDCRVFLWNSDGKYQKRHLLFFSSFQRKDHVDSYESFKAHSNPVTAAIFAPNCVQNLLKSVQLRPLDVLQTEGLAEGQIIVTADITGQIKIFENNSKLENWLKE